MGTIYEYNAETKKAIFHNSTTNEIVLECDSLEFADVMKISKALQKIYQHGRKDALDIFKFQIDSLYDQSII